MLNLIINSRVILVKISFGREQSDFQQVYHHLLRYGGLESSMYCNLRQHTQIDKTQAN